MTPALWLVVLMTLLSVLTCFIAAGAYVAKFSYAANLSEWKSFNTLTLMAAGMSLSFFLAALSVPVVHA